jgi:hypothetical protein
VDALPEDSRRAKRFGLVLVVGMVGAGGGGGVIGRRGSPCSGAGDSSSIWSSASTETSCWSFLLGRRVQPASVRIRRRVAEQVLRISAIWALVRGVFGLGRRRHSGESAA